MKFSVQEFISSKRVSAVINLCNITVIVHTSLDQQIFFKRERSTYKPVR